jgi:hypothetical protein
MHGCQKPTDLFGEGLMDTPAAESLADRLWDPDGEPLPEPEIADDTA